MGFFVHWFDSYNNLINPPNGGKRDEIYQQ